MVNKITKLLAVICSCTILMSILFIELPIDASESNDIQVFDPYSQFYEKAKNLTGEWVVGDYSGMDFSVFGKYFAAEDTLSETALYGTDVYLTIPYNDTDGWSYRNNCDLICSGSKGGAIGSRQATNGSGSKITLEFTAPTTGTYTIVPRDIIGTNGKSMLLTNWNLDNNQSAGDFTQTFSIRDKDGTKFTKTLQLTDFSDVTDNIDDNLVFNLSSGEKIYFDFSAETSWAKSDLYVNFTIELTDDTILSDLQFEKTGEIYEKYEISFNVNSEFENPFDPEDITVNGIFTYPDNSVVTVPAFYIEPLKYKTEGTTLMTYDQNLYESTGEAHWCVRFSGNQVGNYSFRIQVISGGTNNVSSRNNFKLKDSESKGFVDISKLNSKYFVNSADGSLFYGLGSNIAWVRDQFTTNPEHMSYEYFVSQAKSAQSTLTRVWLCHWAWLEWMPQEGSTDTYSYKGLGRYNQCISSALDNVFSLCEDAGIRIILTLDDNDEHKSGETYDSWYYNPYNSQNGGPASSVDDYWSNATVRKYYKNRLRYIIARWGYSTSLASLNLWNDQTTPTETIKEYLNELNEYTDSLTLGYRPLLFGANFRSSANEVLDYATTNTVSNADSLDKPSIAQECYYTDNTDYFKTTLQNTLWNELFSSSAATMVWSHDKVDETGSWDIFTGILNFIKRLPLHKYQYKTKFSEYTGNIDNVGTWANGGHTPTLSLKYGKLNISLSKDTYSNVTIGLANPSFTADAQGIEFYCDGSEITTDSWFRINIYTKVNDVQHTYMPWYGKKYYFTPVGGGTQELEVGGNSQWNSWMDMKENEVGKYFIPFDTFQAPAGATVDSGYGYNISDDVGCDFRFDIQQSASGATGEILKLGNIAWRYADYSINAQDFSRSNTDNALTARYENANGFKAIEARSDGSITYGVKATANEFVINETDSDMMLTGIADHLYGSFDRHTERRNDPTFIVNTSAGGEMVVMLNNVGSYNNIFTVTKNGSVYTSVTFGNGGDNAVDNPVTEENRYIKIPLSVGENRITISNTGYDWITVARYYFKFNSNESESSVSVRRMISENQQLCLVKNNRSGEIYSAVFEGADAVAKNVAIPLFELQNGEYRLEIIKGDGSAITSKNVTVKNGIYIVEISEVENVCVIKMTKNQLFGDCNNDNKLDIRDLVKTKKYLLDHTTELNFELADLNVNGDIETVDFNLLKKLLLGENVTVGY